MKVEKYKIYEMGARLYKKYEQIYVGIKVAEGKMVMTLEEAIKKIQPLDEEAMEYTRARWNTLGKPLHSLGRLEEMVTQVRWNLPR